MMRLALIMPYYGKLPEYFNYFLDSLEGKEFDLLFFSDLGVQERPSNFKHFHMTFDEFKSLAGRKLGVPVRLDSPRRLCDFKPMYGKIFEDWLGEYDYWAFGDCDLVYGNKFNDELRAAVESGCDIFSTEKWFCAGPFCMIRNTGRMNELYKKADNWRDIAMATGNECRAFDELCGFWHFQLRKGEMTIDDCHKISDSFSAVVLREPCIQRRFKTIMYQDDLSGGGIVRMSPDGRLSADNEEIAVYHWVRAKMRRHFKYVPRAYESNAGYRITKTGFYADGWQWRFHLIISFWRLCHSKTLALARRLARRRG